MSLVVTFNGQFKNYKPSEVKHNHRLQRISQVAPAFNDLLHDYLEKESIQGQIGHDTHDKKAETRANPNIKSYEKIANEKSRRLYARDIMSETIHSLGPQNTINDAIQLMGKFQFHHIPIVKEDTMQGIVSDRLVLKSLASGSTLNTPLEKVMIKKVLTAQTHTSISDIARAMLVEKISCLPVTDNKLKVKGILTSSDILSLLISSFPIEVYG